MKTVIWPMVALMCGFIIAAAIHQGFKGYRRELGIEGHGPTGPPKNVMLKKATQTQLQVTGIMYSPDKPSAIVNSNIVHEGDAVGDVMIIEIENGWVRFEKRGKSWAQVIEEQATGRPE